MTSSRTSSEEGDIDLETVLAMIRPALPVAVLVGMALGSLGYLYSSSKPDTYVSVAKFTINQKKESGLGTLLSGDFGASPLGGGSGDSLSRIVDKIMARDFILKLFGLDVDGNPIVQSEESSGEFIEVERPPIIDIGVFLIGDNAPDLDGRSKERRHEAAIKGFRDSVTIDPQKNGVIRVVASHTVPETAAGISNTVVEAYLASLDETQTKNDDRQVDMFQRRLTAARTRLDTAMNKRRDLALTESIGSTEELARRSAQLAQFRNKLQQSDAVIKGIRFLEDRRARGAGDTIKAEDVFSAHPLAFSTLENRLNWQPGQENVRIPSSAALSGLRGSLSDEYGQLQRSILVLEAATERSADGVSRALELEREVEVSKAIYEGLVTQFEAVNLGVDLKAETGELIQTASTPLSPVSSGTLAFTIAAAIAGGVMTLLAGFITTFMSGRIHSTGQIRRITGAPPRATGIAAAVGAHPGMLQTLARKPAGVRNIGLMNLSLSLFERGSGVVSVMGIPKTGIARNLSVMLGGVMATKNDRVAVFDLSASGSGGGRVSMDVPGDYTTQELDPGIALLSWRDAKNSHSDTGTLGEALDQVAEEFDHLIVLCAPLREGMIQNKIALGRSSHVIMLATLKKTTALQLEQALSIVGEFDDLTSDMVVA